VTFHVDLSEIYENLRVEKNCKKIKKSKWTKIFKVRLKSPFSLYSTAPCRNGFESFFTEFFKKQFYLCIEIGVS